MMSRYFLMIILVSWVVYFEKLEAIHNINQQEDDFPVKYCGPILSSTLRIVCTEYNQPINLDEYEKRSFPDSRMNEIQKMKKKIRVDGRMYPLNYGRTEGASLFEGMFNRRLRGGAYDECCLKGCTYQELKDYCKV